MANELTEFLIQKETLEAAADSIRAHLGETSYVFIPSITPGFIKTPITRHFYEDFDVEVGEQSAQESTLTNCFQAAGYEKNDEGILVPVLYELLHIDGNIYIDRYFYIGQAVIDQQSGQLYDKWRKIEDAATPDNGVFWDSANRSYVYTDIVVTTGNNAEAKINPTDFPNKIMEVYATGLSASGIKNANEEVY
jgi:hypothetical protein